MGSDLLEKEKRNEALTFARKVMAFARQNVDVLIERLQHSGYRFANDEGPRKPAAKGTANCIDELANRGIYFPISLQAWLMEVGNVDFCGTHPDWPRTAYSGLGDNKSGREPWYTDPLFIWFSPRSVLESLESRDQGEDFSLEVAPDVVHKANVSGGAPISINARAPAFDSLLVGQSGSFTLLSYLRWAFQWSGFPGFEYIPDAPKKYLKELGRGLTRL
jgi:hypothetical protein